MHMNRRQAGTAVAALFAQTAAPATAQTAPLLPVGLFFQEPAMADAVLSPSGQSVALRIGSKDDRVRLSVLDLQTMKVTTVATFIDADVARVQWVNDQRLVFGVSDNRTAPADQREGTGLYAVNADGEGFRQLVRRSGSFFNDPVRTNELPWNNFLLGHLGAQDNDQVFIVQPEAYSDKGVDFIKLLRLDTRTSKTQDVEAPLNAFQWLIDGRGQLLAVLTEKDQTAALHFRDATTGNWRKLREFERFLGRDMTLQWAGPDGRIYVTASSDKGNAAVFTFDPANNRLSDKPVLSTPGFDIDPSFIANDNKLLGLRFTVDAEVTQWFDDDMKGHQAEVDRQLPATANTLQPSRRGASPFAVVRAFADLTPAVFYLYNKSSQKLTRLGAAMPDVKPAQMAAMDMVRFKARDGLEIPAYLTLPRGDIKKGLPLVVMVHGGPWVRGAAWGWNAEVQFLASRGYAVLQPEFRGSRGFGDRHFRAGFKQWGLAMQDDLTDAARWAIAQGTADPKRIAILGASYGGYAAMMGLAKDGDLFRCAVNWVGVSDLELLYSASWDDLPAEYKRYGMPVMVGDPKNDAAQLKATSPVHNTARIKNPLLMAYGGVDRRVPIEHGKRMRDALAKAGNANVEWIEYAKEGHGWALAETRVDFWTRVENFLSRHLTASA